MMRMALAFLAGTLLCSCGESKGQTGRFIPHPDNPKAKVEYFIEAPAGKGPWPTIVFLHGHQDASSSDGGHAFVRWGELKRNAAKGYLAVAVSLPGFGNSTGPADFAGPYTQHAVESVLTHLQAQHLVKPKAVLLHGVSLGAVTAAMIATRRNDIDGLVLISGLYDLKSYFDGPLSNPAQGVKTVMFQQTGGSPEAMQDRSALLTASNIKAATLILAGKQDDRTSPDQASQLYAMLRSRAVRAELIKYPQFGHEIPFEARKASVDGFVDSVLSGQ